MVCLLLDREGDLELEILFHKDCSLGLVNNLTTRDRQTDRQTGAGLSDWWVGGWGRWRQSMISYACALIQGRVVVSMSENTELCCGKHSVSLHTSLKQTNLSVRTTEGTTTQRGWWWWWWWWWWRGLLKEVLAFRISVLLLLMIITTIMVL